MESEWAKPKNADVDPFFRSRTDVVIFLDIMLRHKMFHRAKKVPVSEEELKAKKMKNRKEKKGGGDTGDEKKKKEDVDDGESKKKKKKGGEENKEQADKAQVKKKIRLEMHYNQMFTDGLDAYVWLYDPMPFYYWIFGFLVVIGSIGICLFPLWPPSVRMGVQYLSIAGACFIAFIIILAILRLIMFCLVWMVTFGKFHLWLFPNLTEDVGFFASFWPLYQYEFKTDGKSKKSKSSKKNKKDKQSDEEEEEEEEFHDTVSELKKRSGGDPSGNDSSSPSPVTPTPTQSKLTQRSQSDAGVVHHTHHRGGMTSSSSEDGDSTRRSSLASNLQTGCSLTGGGGVGNKSKIPLHADNSIDFDAIYEDASDTEINMESQSVVTHLISQVKIGMDLTKVVLPTFILERRSLLEMYADYFAHPDIFLKATELKSERERMVQIVKWYLASFHAGRKSAVAKKPYNPILGETFRCHWDLPPTESGPASSELVTDGPVPWCTADQLTFISEQVSHHPPSKSLVTVVPVPWCTADQLTFISEQVSHHPPISAFYAEHVAKRASLCAHVWTKSKFLGLSIGVHNVGWGTVKLHDFGEDYVCTFPNGYGRSILTVPWIELGGSTTIKCTQSGYHANVEFHTKPFYGGKKHRITTEVFARNEKKPFLVVQGEWNGAMEAKWADGRSELFIDVTKLPISKKIVRKIDEQDETESRAVWKNVTLGLKYNDIDHATNAKSEVEQRQREGAAERLKNNLEWTTQYFDKNPHDDSYYYKNPLEKRLAR
uniref:Oxysterol-binding protein n=1 Tax=Cacopsylla melanoneura TaxID=428564 RepID=A0A8D9EII1_9HEMI